MFCIVCRNFNIYLLTHYLFNPIFLCLCLFSYGFMSKVCMLCGNVRRPTDNCRGSTVPQWSTKTNRIFYYQRKQQSVWVFFTLSTDFWMHSVIEVLIEQTQTHKGRGKAMKSETERCNQLTKFALVVSQNTFLKEKGGWVWVGGLFYT